MFLFTQIGQREPGARTGVRLAMTSGWKLDAGQRLTLLRAFPPTWPDVIADHVTLRSGDGKKPAVVRGEIVGQVDDGAGLQAMVVSIEGRVDRPDGSTFHITWSLDSQQGRRAVQSNDVLKQFGW